MSHWVTKKSEVLKDVNKDLLRLALKDMDLDINDHIKEIRNVYGNERVDAAIIKRGGTVTLGFNFTEKDGKTEANLVGDFFNTGIREESFIDTLSQHYQKHNVVEKLTEQSWDIDSLEVNDKNEYVIEATQWS